MATGLYMTSFCLAPMKSMAAKGLAPVVELGLLGRVGKQVGWCLQPPTREAPSECEKLQP